MNQKSVIFQIIEDLLQTAESNYIENQRNDFDAGRVDGIKQVYEKLIEALQIKETTKK